MKVCCEFVMWKLARLSCFFVSVGGMAQSSDDYWDEGFGLPGSDLGGIAAIVKTENCVFVGGNFSSIGGISAADIAKWDGTNWFPVGEGNYNGYVVYALAWDGADLYAGGWFSEIGGVQGNNIAKWDGKNWSALGGGLGGSVLSLAVVGSSVYAGGIFETADGIRAPRIAKWDGKAWSDVEGGVTKTNNLGPIGGGFDDAAVLAFAVDGTNLYVGGQFDRAGGVEANGVARWDGREWHALGGGLKRNSSRPFNARVKALAVLGTSLFAGGAFHFAGSVSATNIARWDGRDWHPLGSGVNDFQIVQALVASEGNVYAGGVFQYVGDVDANSVARWDGREWTSLGRGINPGRRDGGVTALAVSGGQLFVGGQFSFAGDFPSTNIAIWHIPQTLKVEVANRELILSWPKPDANFVLESSESLAPGNWSSVPTPPVLLNNRLTVKELISSRQKFYRLRQP